MKIYSNTENTNEICFEFDYICIIDLQEISACYDPIYSSDEIYNDAIDDAETGYYDFITNIINLFEQYGYRTLEYHRSNRKNSKSHYVTVCNIDDYNKKKVRIIFNLRISDHKIPNEINGYNRLKSQNEHNKDELKKYSNLNPYPNLPINIQRSVIFKDMEYTDYFTIIKKVQSEVKKLDRI